MALKVQCPSCGKSGSVPEGFGGKSIRCPHCRDKFSVAPAPGAPAPTLAGPAEARITGGAIDTAKPAAAGPEPTDAGPAPTRISRFEVRGLLGRGAFGTVYRAYDRQLDREVALKVPQAGALEDPRAVERFLREAKAAARLRHPHIVPVHDAGRDGETYYIASAFIEGRTLAHAIEEGKLDARASAGVVRGLAEALAYAHRQGVVHRDVKPANVMLDADGEAHLMDFGLATRHDATVKLTQDGAVLGTPSYMAPEQAAGQSGEAKPASDQYGLGVVLYELLCGRTPFGGTPQVVLYNAIHREPPAPRSVKPSVPRDLETICLKAMAKDPGRRYASCQDLADDLRRWLEGEPIRARRLPAAVRLLRWCRRNPAVAGLLAALALSLLLGTTLSAIFALRAKRANAEAESKRDLLQTQEHLLYPVSLRDALWAVDEGDPVSALQSLYESVPPGTPDDVPEDYGLTPGHAPGRPGMTGDWRGFEWYYLRRLCHPKAHELPVADWGGPLLLSGDGRRIAIRMKASFGPGGDAVSVWDWRARREVHQFSAPGGIFDWDYSPDGKSLALRVHNPPDIIVWPEVEGGPRTGGILPDWSASTVGLLGSPHGRGPLLAASALFPGRSRTGQLFGIDSIKVWDVDRQTVKWSITGGFGRVRFSPDGRRLAATVPRNGIAVYDVDTGKREAELPTSGAVINVVFSPDGKRLAVVVGGVGGRLGQQYVEIIDAQTGKMVCRCEGDLLHNEGFRFSFAFSADSHSLMGLDTSNAAVTTSIAWDAETGKRGRGGWVVGEKAYLGPTGSHYVALQKGLKGGATFLRVIDERTGKVYTLSQHVPATGLPPGVPQSTLPRDNFSLNQVALTPDGTVLAALVPSATKGAVIKIWSLLELGKGLQLRGHSAAVTALAFSPDGKQLAGGDAVGNVIVWDAAAGEEVRRLQGSPDRVAALAWSADGGRLADFVGMTLKVWEIGTGREIVNQLVHEGRDITDYAFSPDGNSFAVEVVSLKPGGLAYELKILDVAAGREIGSTGIIDRSTANRGRQFTFSPDGKRFAIVRGANGIETWSVRPTRRIDTIREDKETPPHTAETESTAPISNLLFNPSGTQLTDGERVWNLETKAETPRQHQIRWPGPVNNRSEKYLLSPDQTRLVVCVGPVVEVRDSATGGELLRLRGHTAPVNELAFSRDGYRLATASEDGTVRVWDATPPNK